MNIQKFYKELKLSKKEKAIKEYNVSRETPIKRVEYTLPSLELNLNTTNGTRDMNPDSLQTVTEEYIIEYLKNFIESFNVKRSTTTITSFTSTQRRTTKKLAIFKYIIITTLEYKYTPEDEEPALVEDTFSKQVSNSLKKDAFSAVIQKDELIRVTVMGVVVVRAITLDPTPMPTPNPKFLPTDVPTMLPTSSPNKFTGNIVPKLCCGTQSNSCPHT